MHASLWWRPTDGRGQWPAAVESDTINSVASAITSQGSTMRRRTCIHERDTRSATDASAHPLWVSIQAEWSVVPVVGDQRGGVPPTGYPSRRRGAECVYSLGKRWTRAEHKSTAKVEVIHAFGGGQPPLPFATQAPWPVTHRYIHVYPPMHLTGQGKIAVVRPTSPR